MALVATLTLGLMLSRSGWVVYNAVLVAWTVIGSSPEPPPMLADMSASMWSKRLSCHADLYIVSRCHTRGESQEFIAHRWQSMQVRDPPWLWNPGETLPEVQNRSISGPTKRTYVLQKIFKKKTLGLTCVHFSVRILTKHFNLNHNPRHNVYTIHTKHFQDIHRWVCPLSKKRQNTVNNYLDTFPASS